MAFKRLETIYVIEMTNVETNEITTLASAFISLKDAYACIDECKRSDERTETTEWWTYRVRRCTLFR